jgi:hypothetical protein
VTCREVVAKNAIASQAASTNDGISRKRGNILEPDLG